MQTTIKHRNLNRKVSYRMFIRLECYKLIKHFINDERYKVLKVVVSMFVIVTYDIVEARSLNRIRRYLENIWLGRKIPVFEGNITEGKLHKCISEIEKYYW